jgi:streptogramin lyase
VTASPHAVWVALPNGNSIVHVDPATNGVVATARIGYPPCGFLTGDETGVWSAGCGDLVARIDSRTNEVTAKLTEPSPEGIEVAFGSLWVVAEGSGNVDQVDPDSGRLVARLHMVGLPIRIGVGFGSVWVNDDFGRVLRIKPQR